MFQQGLQVPLLRGRFANTGLEEGKLKRASFGDLHPPPLDSALRPNLSFGEGERSAGLGTTNKGQGIPKAPGSLLLLNTEAGLGLTLGEHVASCPGPQITATASGGKKVPGPPTWPPITPSGNKDTKDTLVPPWATCLKWKPAGPSQDSCPQSTQKPGLQKRRAGGACGL